MYAGIDASFYFKLFLQGFTDFQKQKKKVSYLLVNRYISILIVIKIQISANAYNASQKTIPALRGKWESWQDSMWSVVFCRCLLIKEAWVSQDLRATAAAAAKMFSPSTLVLLVTALTFVWAQDFFNERKINTMSSIQLANIHDGQGKKMNQNIVVVFFPRELIIMLLQY